MEVTLAGVLRGAIARHHARVALQFGDQQWTYKDLDTLSDALATGLTRLGISPGSCVALYLKNCAEYVIADLALLKVGAIKVPLNEFQSSGDVTYVLADTGTRALFAHQSLLSGLGSEALSSDAPRHVICVPETTADAPRIPHHHWSDVLIHGAFNPCRSSPDDVAMITYTGGTTGKPKGVVQTQASLAINLCAHINAGEICASEVMLLSTPLPHSAGYHLQAGLLQGCRLILQQRFVSADFYEAVEHEKVTWTFLVPTMIYRLLDHPGASEYHHTSLRTIVYGAAPMATARLQSAIDRFGQCFIQLYGQTECPNYITALTKDDHRNTNLHSSCGKAVPFVEIATTAEDGKGIGEVIVRSPYLMSEYLQNPDATKAALDRGWLHTGDIGLIDDNGYLFLKDRAKDMIISGGMNVYTTEVEQVIKRHTDVVDAAVVGLPHDDWGEQVHAVVVLRNGADVSAPKLIEHCRNELSKYKLPKSVEFRTSLPVTAYGKIDKKLLRNNRTGGVQ